jgi:KUP system potassium uptake protein
VKVVAADLGSVVVPTAIAILIGLFARRGTHVVGVLFGPIMVVWFVAIGLAGVREGRSSRRS